MSNAKFKESVKSPYKGRNFAGHNKKVRKNKQSYREKITICKQDELRYEEAHAAWWDSVCNGDGLNAARKYREFMR